MVYIALLGAAGRGVVRRDAAQQGNATTLVRDSGEGQALGFKPQAPTHGAARHGEVWRGAATRGKVWHGKATTPVGAKGDQQSSRCETGTFARGTVRQGWARQRMARLG